MKAEPWRVLWVPLSCLVVAIYYSWMGWMLVFATVPYIVTCYTPFFRWARRECIFPAFQVRACEVACSLGVGRYRGRKGMLAVLEIHFANSR